MTSLRFSKSLSKPFSFLLSSNPSNSRVYTPLSQSILNNRSYSTQELPSRSSFGHHAFRGQVAAPYLKKVGLAEDTMESSKWIVDGNQDKVAQAVLDWARDHGASVYCHQFQPQGSENLRHGYSAQVQKAMFDFDKSGKLRWNFNGKTLLSGETDGSSLPNGGLRGTHHAGGYLVTDPTSTIYLKEDTVFLPSCFVSFYGKALDEKTPLLRAMDALSREGTRMLSLLGLQTDALSLNIGLEQEFFLVPRHHFKNRLDLRNTGRTLIGADASRGQELSDHYMGPPSLAHEPIKFMREVQHQCYQLGIPLITRHREVAPGQYEFAPMFGNVTSQIDQNIAVMQIISETAIKNNLAALLHEKPFKGVNGSGKHNNWSIGTSDGLNLLNPNDLYAATGSVEIFPLVMAAILSAIDSHADLIRASIATPGNDFRLGACEAPPSIISVHLGESMTQYLQGFKDGAENSSPYRPNPRKTSLGISSIPSIDLPVEDRNRTSPMAYGGHRFELRAVGSSQNVSLVNTVIATICAKAFKTAADELESGKTAATIAQTLLREHWRIIFNDNGYSLSNQNMLKKRHLCHIDSNPKAIQKISAPKNLALFEEMGVLDNEETVARAKVLLNHYVGVVEMEAKCLQQMITQDLLPAAQKVGETSHTNNLKSSLEILQNSYHKIEETRTLERKATLSREYRVETMMEARKACDSFEKCCPSEIYPYPKYQDLLFID